MSAFLLNTFQSFGSGGGGGGGPVTVIDQDLGSSPSSSIVVDVSGFSDVEIILSKVNNAGDASIACLVSSDGGSTYETSNIWEWDPTGGRNTQTSIVLKRAYAGVCSSLTVIRNVNDADAGIAFFTYRGDLADAQHLIGGQSTPSAIDTIKIEATDSSSMDEGHIIVRGI